MIAVAHSLARPEASPSWVLIFAFSFNPRNLGRATALRMPTITITTISSTKVKPLLWRMRAKGLAPKRWWRAGCLADMLWVWVVMVWRVMVRFVRSGTGNVQQRALGPLLSL